MRLFLLSVGCWMVIAGSAWAQQPALPGAPQPTTLPTSALIGPGTEVIGQTYSVELRSGTSFLGTLRAATSLDLTFDTKDLGVVTVQRANLRQLVPISAEQARRGYDDVGNGTRLFFAPTARNLRRGEGYVQDIDVYLVGANYGITNNISVGVLVPIIPGLGLNVFAVTPKVSVPVTEKFSVGAGLLYANAFGYGAGIGYGVATYGTADTNLTAGLGYAFARGETSSTPVVVLGGAVRVSRRFFLIDETYIVGQGIGGLLGARVAAARASGSLGLLYATDLGGIYPAYLEFAYRFGKVVPKR
ncbi:hypothetical protein GO988_07595 [Hymenobacter sp. HMF4947]|uniref:Uncharacterized protein n=1 Tax=Hymenobacter ginkgonis TaxID=2682976 RepID=A0A7K1TCT2_9BACT|nr:hypothetical protein [Hymenobacter ginkgonis]MVN76185.1 hypothetical protein [Hymenobacter ginkgonis]